MSITNPVHEFLDADGETVGCGTKLELDHWTAEGVMVDCSLGAVVTHEPAEMDEQRKVEWALETVA